MYHTRWMIRRDMQDVLEIEKQCFEFPWTEEEFLTQLRKRNVIGMVCVDECHRVMGFMIYGLHKNRLHLLSLAVGEQYRREGVGTTLVNKLVSKLSHERRNRITTDIRETNLVGQLFFRDQGFRAVNIIRDYYDETSEDAYHMVYTYATARLTV